MDPTVISIIQLKLMVSEFLKENSREVFNLQGKYKFCDAVSFYIVNTQKMIKKNMVGHFSHVQRIL